MNDSRGTSRRGNYTCAWYGCNRPTTSNGYCKDHHAEYQREWRQRVKPIFKITRGELEQALEREVTDQEVAVFVDFITADVEQQVAAAIEYIKRQEQA